MTHEKFFRVLSLSVALVVVLFSASAFAQSVEDDWERVQKLKTGAKLVVKTKSGEKRVGKVKSITADSILLALSKDAGRELEIKRDEIREIRRKSAGMTAAYAALLGGVGAAAGYGIGYGLGEANQSRYRPEYPFAGFGAAIGAVTGALIGNKGELIYKSR